MIIKILIIRIIKKNKNKSSGSNQQLSLEDMNNEHCRILYGKSNKNVTKDEKTDKKQSESENEKDETGLELDKLRSKYGVDIEKDDNNDKKWV